jgi:hypothetical protein
MKPRLLRCLALAAGLSAAGPVRAADPSAAAESTPAKNWVLPRFTKEGFRWMTLRGTEVRQVRPGEIAVVGMNITVFSRDATDRIESILLSPSALYDQRENRASGEQAVRLIDFRDDLEVEGVQWTYDQDQKKISIARNVRVVIHTPLPVFFK